MDWPESGFDPRLVGLGIALGLGLLVGLEREWEEDTPIGLRSFALIGLLGGLAALFVEPFGVWPLSAGFLALGVLLAYRTRPTRQAGVTTLVAALLVYLLGAAAVIGYWLHAIVLGGTVTVILHWKRRLHGLVDRLGRDDIETIARFVLITLVVLPVLPNQAFGPWQVFNPFQAWLLVVLIVTINLVGYVAYRVFGAKAGGWLAGVLGGMVSSTATSLSYATLSRRTPDLGALATLVILVASAVVYLRILVELALVAPALLPAVAWPSAVFAAVLLAIALVVWFAGARASGAEAPQRSNPAQIRVALAFGVLYTVILFAVAAARERLGEDAVLGVALVSGFTDVDALTLSMAKLYDNGDIAMDTAWRAIFLASLANLVFKIGIACVLGSGQLRRWVLAAGLPALAGGGLVLVLWP